MTWQLGLIAAASGYLAGAIPFAWIIARLIGRGAPLEPIELPVPGTDRVIRSNAVSATAVRLQFGARYGCLTSLLDMAKAAGVTLVFKQLHPEEPAHLVAAALAVVGHIWPLFHGFRGGRGQSPIIGSLLVIDWPAALIAYPAAQLLGLATGLRAYVGRFAPTVIAAGWFAYRFRDLSHVLFALGLFVVRIFAMRHEMRQYTSLRRAGSFSTLQEEAQLLRFGERFERWIARITGGRSRGSR